jgi:hypothetical protein
MKWITREYVRVGRMGIAWLVRKYIDPQAEFLCVPGNQVLSEAERLGATAFHVPGSESERQGGRSSFEVMVDRYHLTDDPALVLLGKIVGTADVANSPWQLPEGPGLKAATEGIHAGYSDDQARLDAAMPLYDAFYTYCREVIAHGKPNGAFKP